MKTFISQDHRPATFKMFQRLESNPRIRAYIKGGRWEHRPATPLVGMYSAGVMTNDWEKCMYFSSFSFFGRYFASLLCFSVE